ncbi:hypothetical protein BT69DRAFT_126177 [Atractiella rhizophila]|nr:hypothetical protein BT69DRAFT_126177 [Atractiella rhizophila]
MRIKDLSGSILRSLFLPLLESPSSSSSLLYTLSSPTPSTHVIKITAEASALEPFATLTEVATFLSAYLFPDTFSDPTRTLFAKLTVPSIQSSILSNLLLPSLPHSFSKEAFAEFEAYLQSAVAFEDHLVEIGYLLEQDDDNRLIKEWKSNVGHIGRGK